MHSIREGENSSEQERGREAKNQKENWRKDFREVFRDKRCISELKCEKKGKKGVREVYIAQAGIRIDHISNKMPISCFTLNTSLVL